MRGPTHHAEKIIFFIHGNSSSANIWQPQFEAEQLSAYCLIALDLPAHGDSSVADDYSLPALGRMMGMAVTELAGEKEYMIAGQSLGVNILAEMLAHRLSPKGLAAFSSCAMGGSFTMDRVFKPDADLRPSVVDDLTKEELQHYWRQSCLCMHDEQHEKYRQFEKDYFAVKDNFRSKIFTSFGAGQIGDEVGLLLQAERPMLIVFGEEEKTCNIDYLDKAGLTCWQDKVHKLPGAGHLLNIDLPEKTNELLAAFAGDVF